MASSPRRRYAGRRALVDLSQSQTGDASFGNVAGENIYSGLSPEHVAAVLDREITFRNEVLKAYERDNREIRARFDRAARDTELYRELERDEREKRQRESDRARQELAAQVALANRRTMHWLIALTVALVASVALLGWLLYDRYTAAAVIQLWIGGGLALALSRR